MFQTLRSLLAFLKPAAPPSIKPELQELYDHLEYSISRETALDAVSKIPQLRNPQIQHHLDRALAAAQVALDSYNSKSTPESEGNHLLVRCREEIGVALHILKD